MPDEPPPSLPTTPPPRTPGVRPRVPGWMWALFGLGLVPVGVLICVVLTHPPANQLGAVSLVGAVGGLLLGLPMLGGLALAARFFHETGARVVMGGVFAVVITVGVAGILFAGCMCLVGGTNMH